MQDEKEILMAALEKANAAMENAAVQLRYSADVMAQMQEKILRQDARIQCLEIELADERAAK